MADDLVQEVFDALGLLRPYDIDLPKVRIGPNHDGGYILADYLGAKQTVVSYGIATEYEFDRIMAERGHRVFMFDHTIPGIHDPHPNMHFYREGLAGGFRADLETGFSGATDYENSLFSIADHIKRHSIGDDGLILKMDVEGYEWGALAALDDDTLRKFEQIVMEVHSLESLESDLYRKVFVAALEKINRHFTLFHVHANNVDGPDTYKYVSGMPVSVLMEVSYIRTDLVNRRPSRTVYPTPIDVPNFHDRDRLLWMYPFVPQNASEGAFLESASSSRMATPNGIHWSL